MVGMSRPGRPRILTRRRGPWCVLRAQGTQLVSTNLTVHMADGPKPGSVCPELGAAWSQDLGCQAFEGQETQVQSVDGPSDTASSRRAHTPGPFPAASLGACSSGSRSLAVRVPGETI